MRILLIGNFAPPFEDENLHNLSIFKRLKDEGNDCSIINISINPSKEEGVINSDNYIDFVLKVIRHGWRKDVIHFMTKAYTRLSLLKLISMILVARVFGAKPVVSLHSELFSVIGQMRSKVGGEQIVYLVFSFAHKIIFGDRDTYDVASRYRRRDNFELIPLFIQKDRESEDGKASSLNKLKENRRIILFSNVQYPSFLFDILNNLVSKTFTSDVGIVISLSEVPSAKLQHVIEEASGDISENIVFLSPDDMDLLSRAYGMADLVVRPLSCDGKIFFQSFAIYLRRPEHSEGYVYFPGSLVFVKEGKTSDLCACIISDLLSKKRETSPELNSEDFYAKVRKIYE